MDVLNRAYALLYDRYRSMTPGARLMAGLLMVVVILSAGYLFTHQMANPDVDLMHGVPLSAAELQIIEAALGKAGLRYEIHGASILVPRGQEAACMAALHDADALPKQCGDVLSTALNSTGPFEDHRVTDQKAKLALQEVLAKAIGAMPGIERASVLYDVDNKPGFNKEKVATAIAFVKSVGANQLSEAQVAAIRQAVGGGAVASLKPENVTVADLSGGRTWYAHAEDGGSGGEENLYLAVQRTYEQGLRTKILNALCYIPQVTVEVSVDLDRERGTHIRQDRRSPRDERHNAEPVRGHVQAGHPDRPAATAQQPNTAAVLNALLNGGHSDEEARDAEAADLGSHEHVEKESVGLTPLRASVSVGVPVSYFKNVWQERNPIEAGRPAPKPSAAALKQIQAECCAMIQKHVATLLPLPEGAAKPAESVTVSTFEPIPVQEPPPPDFNETLLNWLRQSWTTLGMIALGLLSLLIVRSIVRSAPPPPQVQTMSASAGLPDQLDAIVDDKTDDNVEPKIPRPHARRFEGAVRRCGRNFPNWWQPTRMPPLTSSVIGLDPYLDHDCPRPQPARRRHPQGGHPRGQPRSNGGRSAARTIGPAVRCAGPAGRRVGRADRCLRTAAGDRRVPPHRLTGPRQMPGRHRSGWAAGPAVGPRCVGRPSAKLGRADAFRRQYAAIQLSARDGRGAAFRIARRRACANHCRGALPVAARSGRCRVGATGPAAASRGRPPPGRTR